MPYGGRRGAAAPRRKKVRHQVIDPWKSKAGGTLSIPCNRKHVYAAAMTGALLLTLTACGTGSTAQDTAGTSAAAASSGSPAAIAKDAELVTAVPAEIRNRGTLIIGTNAP